MDENIIERQFLGRILLDRNIIDQNQLNHALEIQKERGECFGDILINLGYVQEHDVVAALVVQCHIPYIAIDRYEIDTNVTRILPTDVIHKYHVIPLDRVNDILSVVMVDPLDTAAIAEIQRITNCRVAPFIGTAGEITKAIQRWYDESPDT